MSEQQKANVLPMHMYCWSRPPSFIAVAQARNVNEARKLVLLQVGHGDGSCPERDKAAEWIKGNNPTIWHGPNAEFELTDSAELADQATFLEAVQRDLKNTQRDYCELRESFDTLRERTQNCPHCFAALAGK